ncbi:MAG: hypothetical protein ACT4QD_20525 [Acidobacteriota bacterium]
MAWIATVPELLDTHVLGVNTNVPDACASPDEEWNSEPSSTYSPVTEHGVS